MNPGIDAAARTGITALAEDVGRLRRVLPDDPMASYATMIVARIADRVMQLDALLEPCAADLCLIAGCDDADVAMVLDVVDEHGRELHRLLGCTGCVECRA